MCGGFLSAGISNMAKESHALMNWMFAAVIVGDSANTNESHQILFVLFFSRIFRNDNEVWKIQ
jgi:hypothetical protein